MIFIDGVTVIEELTVMTLKGMTLQNVILIILMLLLFVVIGLLYKKNV